MEGMATGEDPVREDASLGASVAVPVGRLPARVRGRGALLRLLGKQVARGGLVVLAGMGGLGKSTVAAELARERAAQAQQQDEGCGPVWWVSAADAASLTAGLVTVARRLDANAADLQAVETGAPDGPDRLWSLLENARDGWLLVFDNADDPQLLAAPPVPASGGAGAVPASAVSDGTGWARSGRRGLVLVTSRHADRATWGSLAVVHRLSPLAAPDAGRVLLDRAPGAGTRAQAEALGRRLGGLPLALHLAGANLGSSISRWSSFDAYLEALDAGLSRVEDLRPDLGAGLAGAERATVMRTWELSLDDLAHHDLPQARSLLRMLSCYAPGVPIPLDVLRDQALAGLLEPHDRAAASVPSAEQVLRGLEQVGLIDSAPDGVVVHPVVAETNRAHLRLPAGPSGLDPLLVRQTAVIVLAAACSRLDWQRAADWTRYRALAPHLHALLVAAAADVDDHHLAILVEAATGIGFVYSGLEPTLVVLGDLARLALEHAPRLALEHPVILHARLVLAIETGQWGRAQGEPEIRELFDASRRILGDDHPDTMRIRYLLAYADAHRGRLAEAEATFRELLDTQRRVLGDQHADTFITRLRIADVAAEQGRWAEAEEIILDLLEASRRPFGAAHGVSLSASLMLAWVVAGQGRWTEAETALRELLDVLARSVGETHPISLATRHTLAWVVANQGRWAEAEAGFRDLLDAADREGVSDDYPYRLSTRHALAWVLAGRGRLAEAEAAFRNILEARGRVLGGDHPHTLTTRHELARVVAGQGRLTEAEVALRELVHARERVMGVEHPHTLATRFELARVTAGQGRLAEAEMVLREVLEARRRVLGDDHPDSVLSRRVLGDLSR
jgi:tetratricopeptide (TPR) repeat protein